MFTIINSFLFDAGCFTERPLETNHILSAKPQAAQAQYVWVRASEVIWSEYTRIISKIIIWC